MYRNKRVISLNFSSLLPHLPFIIFSSLFVIGILAGSLCVGKFDFLNEYASNTFNDFIEVRQNKELYNIFKDSVLSILPLYIIVFLFGTSIVGCVCAPLVLLFAGLKYGMISGFLYFTYKLEGIMFSSLVIIPSTLITAFGLILLCREAFNFSYILSGICIKTNKPVNVYLNFKIYCIKSLITAIAALVAILFDIGMSYLFLTYFNF